MHLTVLYRALYPAPCRLSSRTPQTHCTDTVSSLIITSWPLTVRCATLYTLCPIAYPSTLQAHRTDTTSNPAIALLRNVLPVL